MFGGAKPTFGSGTPGTGFGTFNTAATASPFGQSAFGKPATTAFGAAPAFGAQPNQTSLFGAAAGQQQQSTNLFGTGATTSAFGATTAAQPAFGSFSQPQQNTSLFGGTQAAGSTSLFGQAGTSAFGSTVKPASLGGFGQTTTQQPSLFGAATTQTSTSGFGSFGQTAPTTTNVFGTSGTSAFGQPAANVANPGSALVKYNPIVGTETLMKNGAQNNVNTKHHCITAMKEYESKSLEELRMEDYLANRKGGVAAAGGFFGTTPQPATSTGLFGQTAQPQTGLFGQPATSTTENKGLFGSTPFGQNQNSAFGMTQQQSGFGIKPFGATTTPGFGTATDASNNPFGQKPAFGSTGTPSLFGQMPAASTAPAFGQTTTGFGGFGSTAGQTQPSLFGNTAADANKPAFGLGSTSTANTSFGGFGTAQTSTASGGLFDNKPATGFGAAPAFGATSTANTGFAGFGSTGPSLFNTSMNKPATSGFGSFGTQQSNAPLNFNTTSNQPSLFGNTAAKPTGLFGSNPLGGNTTGTGTGLFGNTSTAPNAFGSGLGMGSSLMGGGMQSTLGVPQQPTVPIHQQILSKVTSPYGDTGAFKDLKRKDELDATRATNPEAQKAIIDSTTGQFKINAKSSPGVLKVKPVGNNIMKKSLFEGLEESDSTLESFTLKPNAKRLIIKPKSNSGTPVTQGLNQSSGPDNLDSLNNSLRNDSFTGAIHNENNQNANLGGIPSGIQVSSANKENDTSRRESWLHPNNLEKVRQHNLNAGVESNSPLNSTLTELVPRKPLETYRPSVGGANRLSISTIPENPFEDQSVNVTRRETIGSTDNADDSLFANRSYEEHSIVEEPRIEYEEHPTRIKLTRAGYYTVPSLDDLKSYIAEDGSCIVPNFTIGRTGYGNVYFPKEMDVAGLNIDEIVHFRNKEITIYPDDENKPPVGTGLNREAQVTLDKVWPLDKAKQEPIKDHQRLTEMDWEGRLRRVCDKNQTRFVEFRPETGSWVFKVKHFSKYGLNDSDEEDSAIPTDPKKAKMSTEQMMATKNLEGATALNIGDKLKSMQQGQKGPEDPKSFGAPDMYGLDESAEFMLMDKTKFFQQNSTFPNAGLFEQQKYAQSPSAFLAKASGTDPHKLQLMKASFFMDDETQSTASDMDAEHDFNRNERASMFGASSWMDNVPINAISSGASSQVDFAQMPASSSASFISHLAGHKSETTSVAENEVTTKTLPPFVVTPKVAMIKTVDVQIPYSKSFSYKLANNWVADLGLLNSRKFKTSFGPGSTLIVPSTKHSVARELKNENLLEASSKIFSVRKMNDFSPVVLQHIRLATSFHYEHFEESLVGHLIIQLENSDFEEVEGSECSHIRSKNGFILIEKHLEEAKNHEGLGPFEDISASVWSLCQALWGFHEEIENLDPKSHAVVMFRRDLLSAWLEETLTNKDLLTKSITKNTYLDHLLDLVMCHKIEEACEVAAKYEDLNLAMIIASNAGPPFVKRFAEDQLSKWVSFKADDLVHINRLKLLMLVAGVPLMGSNQGPISLLAEMEWIKTIALQLWYISSSVLSITDTLIAFCNALKGEEFSRPLKPTPRYLNDYETQLSQGEVPYDLRYHLLHLFSKRSYPLEGLLSPATYTADPLDYRLSWLLLETLTALGYTHCSDMCVAKIHVDFAAQLEAYGLWEWAIFVLLHINERNQREIAVQNLLYRYVSITKDTSLTQKEKFLVENLGIPEKWIDYAKAVKAGSTKNYHLQAKYLLKAKQWNLAHELIFQRIAPDAIINNNLDYLRELLIQFESLDLKKSIKVSNWPNQGQIFLDFIDMKEKFDSLKNLQNHDDIEARWENLKPQLCDLCSRINLLPCPTAKHRLCQSEIAENLALLVRGVLVMCPHLDPCLILEVALSHLPLPQEFARKELHYLLDMMVKRISNGNSAQMEEESMAIN